jgi:hypothetical protein
VGPARRRYAIARGVGAAQTLGALPDGGAGLERVWQPGVSGAVAFVGDGGHWSQKRHELGGRLPEQDPGAAPAGAKTQEAPLGDAGDAGRVRALDRRGGPRDAPSAAPEQGPEVRNHVPRNEHGTAYPTYRADVGSGPTEAGGPVMAGRGKEPGMRWPPAASMEVAALKALYASGRGLGEAFGSQRLPNP